MSTRNPAKTKYLIHDSDKIILENHRSIEPFSHRSSFPQSALMWFQPWDVMILYKREPRKIRKLSQYIQKTMNVAAGM